MILRPPVPPPPRAVLWEAQPGPQTALIQCPVFEIFFGGARGGGKTEASIGDWLQHSSEWGSGANGIFFRREQKQLDEVIARSIAIFEPLGAKYNAQKSTWVMPGGGRLKFRYLDRDSDAEAYQGHSYTRVYIEEATNFPSFAPIKKLFATLRSAAGVPCGIRLTGNPGGPGHAWVKDRYIKPAPKGYTILIDTIEIEGFPTMERERVFIPSKITDNLLLMQNNLDYVANLATSGPAGLVKAWLRGDWDTPVGAYFTQFDRNRHVLPARFTTLIPKNALRFGSFDWGYSAPFSFGMWAISDGSWGLPRGAMVRYKEWYGSTGKPNEGLRLDAAQVAQGIKIRIGEDRLSYIAADPHTFDRNGGPSIMETFAIQGVMLRKADNSRIAGWNKVRELMNGGVPHGFEGPLPPPLFYILDNCPDAIRGLESVPASIEKPDDVDTKAEDHVADEIRYGAMSRPWIIDNLPPMAQRPDLCMNSLWEEAERHPELEEF